MLTRRNLATAPRPGLAPDLWTAAAPSTAALSTTTGWDGDTVPCYRWQPPTATAVRLSTPLTGLTVGDRYSWFVAVAPNTPTSCVISVMGAAPVTLAAFAWRFLTGSFVATGADVFTIDTTAAWPAGQYLFVDTLLVEDRHTGDSGRYFDGNLPGAAWDSTPWRSKSGFRYDMDPLTLEPLSGFPLVIVEVDARPPQPWEFALDRSSLDGPDFLPDTPRWTPLTTVSTVGIRRGRSDDNAQVQAGTVSLSCDNYDGLLDPDNPVSPYRPNPSQTYLDRGCALRVSSLGIANALQFTVSSLFTGRVDDWLPDAGWGRSVDVSAVDDLAVVGSAEMPDFGDDPVRTGDTTADRVRWVCQLAGVAAAVSANATRTLLPLAGSGALRSAVDDAATAEAGRFYASAKNVLTLTAHADEYTKVPAVTISDGGDVTARVNVDFEDLSISSGIKELVNQANVDRGSTTPDGELQKVTAADADSVSRAGAQSITVTAPLADPAAAAQLAMYLATRRSKRTRRITGLKVNVAGQAPIWAQRLVRMDLGTHVEVSRLVPYTTGPRLIRQRYSVEQIAHTITPTGWVVDLGFAPVDATVYGSGAGAFLLDFSALDGLDVLTPY